MPSNMQMELIWNNNKSIIENEIWLTFLIAKSVGNDWFTAIITM